MSHLKKEKVFYNTVLLLALSLIFMSCGNRSRSKVDQGAFDQVVGLGFQDVFDQVIDKNCLECHSTYDNYQVVRQLAPDMLDAIITGRMPKNRPALDERLQVIFSSWVNDGAPEIPGMDSVEMPLEATYESILVNVFAPKCLACHSGEQDAPGPASINLSTYEDLIASNNLYAERFGAGFLDTEFPEDSEIIFLLEEGAAEPMPPLTLPGNPDYVRPDSVTAEELEVIIDWISKGLPETKGEE